MNDPYVPRSRDFTAVSDEEFARISNQVGVEAPDDLEPWETYEPEGETDPITAGFAMRHACGDEDDRD